MKIGCVLLAAGEGSRLGKVPKALMRLNGRPLIHHHIEALANLNINDIVVVTGHYADRIEDSIKELSVKVVRNNNPQAEQGSSVRLGIETLGADYDLVLMMLSDQPLINDQDIQEIITTYQADTTRQIILPMVNRTRGNPTAFTGKTIQKILDIKGMVCRKYMDDHPEEIFLYETQNKHFVTDIDRIEDIEAINQDSMMRIELP